MSPAQVPSGLDVALTVIGGKWKPLILFHLMHNTRRYGGLHRAIGGVSDKVLIQQLKELCEDGLVERADFKEIPPRVEYSLTPFGESLAKALATLCQWGTQHEEEVARVVTHRKVREARAARKA
jgi:DNA-binding HxlR family transcriptional regulator